MVRLKEFKNINIQVIKKISIPYGAIKRFADIEAFDSDNNFNSLWCD